MVKVSYDFYKNEYGGSKVENSQFKMMSNKAESAVDRYSFGRSRKVNDDSLMRVIKLTICELVDLSFDFEKAGGGMIKSKSQGKRSVSYGDVSGEDLEWESYSIIRRRLMTTGLLYRGL